MTRTEHQPQKPASSQEGIQVLNDEELEAIQGGAAMVPGAGGPPTPGGPPPIPGGTPIGSRPLTRAEQKAFLERQKHPGEEITTTTTSYGPTR